MYRITCDGFPILDLRDEDYTVDSPRVKMGTNTVGEGSFKIYKTHPHYEDMKKLKSVFEISDDYGVIFRGRMTDSTTDFNNGKKVDLEGVLAYFNDSLIKPFSFPEDFLNDASYNAAAKSGNVVEFLLGWIIEQHNNQVQPFQRFKLGRVTVSDPNNYIFRASESGYITSWEAVKTKLFESALGGYLCIRYEADGNYIDYLADFEEINAQEIVFGENLVDFLQEETATATYTAAVPYGSEVGEEKTQLTIESLPDGDVNSDIVKKGDTLYSKSGVERFGWIYAPISDTTWDDVTDAANLQNKCVDFLENTAMFLTNTIELSAADLHYTDGQIMSFRIYKKVKVNSKPHNLSAVYKLTELEIPLLEPQGTKITVGETRKSLLNMQKDEQYFAKQNMQVITEKVVTVAKAAREAMEKVGLTEEMLLNWCHENDKTLIDGAKIYTGSVKAKQIDVEDLFAQNLSATDLHISGDSTMEGDIVCKDKITIFSEDLESEASISMARSTYSMPNFIVRPDGTIMQNANARNIPFLVVDTAYGLKVIEAINCGDLTATRIGTTGDLTAMGNLKVAGTALIHGGLDLTNSLTVENGGTGASTADGARQNINFLGTFSSVEEDTPAFWISKGTGVAYINSEAVLDNQPTAYGFLFNQTTGVSLVSQIYFSMTGPSVLHTRSGNLNGWYQSGAWHKAFNDYHTIPVENGGTGQTSKYTSHTFTINSDGVEQLNTPIVRYYPYLGLAFIRISVKTTAATAAGETLNLGTLSCRPSLMQPVSGYASKEFAAYVSYSDSGVHIKAREAIGVGYEIRINGWFTIQ